MTDQLNSTEPDNELKKQDDKLTDKKQHRRNPLEWLLLLIPIVFGCLFLYALSLSASYFECSWGYYHGKSILSFISFIGLLGSLTCYLPGFLAVLLPVILYMIFRKKLVTIISSITGLVILISSFLILSWVLAWMVCP